MIDAFPRAALALPAPIVLWQTGGTPALFGYEEALGGVGDGDVQAGDRDVQTGDRDV